MSDVDWLLVGLMVGVIVGIPVGFMLANVLSAREAQPPASVVFQRDSEGRITEIHYIPGVRG